MISNFKGFSVVEPSWPELNSICAFTTLARSGDKQISFSGKSDNAVQCRAALEKVLNPIKPIHWLEQVHENDVLELPFDHAHRGDAAVTSMPGVVCVVRSADCLPVVFAATDGRRVGVAHAGWRGLHAGVLLKTLAAVRKQGADVMVWLGPAIGPNSFEVGPEVFETFVRHESNAAAAFAKRENDKYLCDIYALARLQLTSAGVEQAAISGGGWCTYRDERFHSARRDGNLAGRMATVVLIRIG
ncbi:MAG: peptidoglycan editing factor PgeF [Verrucomicrobiota bacterium]|jgi:YfiH family protein